MKRDMDLIRKIMLFLQDADRESHDGAALATALDEDTERINYHLRLMMEANLIDGRLSEEIGVNVPAATTHSITTSGHDFLAAASDPSVWETAWRRIKASTGSVSIPLLIEVLKATAKDALGLSE